MSSILDTKLFGDKTVGVLLGLSQEKSYLPEVEAKKKKKSQLLGLYDQCAAVTKADVTKEEEHFTNKMKFNGFIGLVICVNAITIGLEVDIGKGQKIHQRLMFFLFEIGFGATFLMELVLKLRLAGWTFFLNPWNVIDYHLVLFSMVDILLSLAFPGGGEMKMLAAFRMVRMVRLVRNVRLLRMFRDLWLLVRGFIATLSTLFWVALLEFMIIFVLALFTAILVGKDPKYTQEWPEAQIYFGSVIKSMVTVFQVATLDAWADIVRPLGRINTLWTFVFVGLIVLVVFGVLNVVIAVIVNRTLTVAIQNEKECQLVVDSYEKQIVALMLKRYKEVAATASTPNELDEEEFLELMRTREFTRWLKLCDMPMDDVEEMFGLMDVDGSESLSPGEFKSGLVRIKGCARGKDMVQLISFIQRALRKASDLNTRMDRIIDKADVNLQRLDDLWGMTEANMLEKECAKTRMSNLKTKMKNRNNILGKLKRNKVAWYKRFL